MSSEPVPGDPGQRRTPGRPTLAPRVRAGLIALLMLALWLTWPKPPSPHLVAVGRDYIAARYPTLVLADEVKQSGWLGNYKLTFTGERSMGDTMTIVLEIQDRAGRVEVVGHSTAISGQSSPVWVIRLVVIAAAAYLLFFVSVPRAFGRRCPRDGSILKSREATVMPPPMDRSGMVLASIIERWYECPQCDFRHIEAMLDPNHRPTGISVTQVGHTTRISAAEEERMKEHWRRRLESAITDEEYDRRLAEAKEAARAKASTDSPWLRG